MGLLSRIKTWVEGDTLTAADLNSEFNNITNNLAPTYIDDDSATEAGMQTVVDPYPGSSASLATNLKGEIERLRYLIAQITGETYWYVDPDDNIAGMVSDIAAIGAVGNPISSINNLSLSATVSGKALTVAAKLANGTDASTGTPITINFRAPTATGSGTFNRTITGALSVVLSSGSTLGFTAAEAGRIYVWAIDNAGTVELALSRTADIFPESVLTSTTAEGGAGAADSTTVMYSTTARTTIPIRCIGYIEIVTGGNAGEWDNAPTKVQVMGPGVKRTGDIVQVKNVTTGAVATGSTVIPLDDTIPQKTEGDEYMTLAITPRSAVNKLIIEVVANAASTGPAADFATALFQDAAADALAAVTAAGYAASVIGQTKITHHMTAGTINETTFKVRMGGSQAGTLTFNGKAAGRIYGGVMSSSITIHEVMA
jgi:hypothetical protein